MDWFIHKFKIYKRITTKNLGNTLCIELARQVIEISKIDTIYQLI